MAVQPPDEAPGRAASPDGRHPDSGFTLIEMIVVLVVLALVGSIVLARGPMHSATLDLRASARAMASDMRRTRAGAIATDHDVVFTADPVQRDYGIRKGARHGLAAAIAIVGIPAPIVFHADGSSSGGVVTLGEMERRLSVHVDWLTGRVDVR
ncbi:prepilin-type N-terminal cleavage/methylation domain-containing protein [Lichenicola cladoniae]|uniref:Prepilin-type N-terminal cleavage/methylation domain-containing protein n=1 Tax=Lichenicola cladoniae TaxID=1484109 RepID=A0A6M8HV89_9PROT|nr:prepilin-type N-terminal cleavage/methylation domain-containing protein [Lichenicola cladoniae]NPD66195.1 prepilin-type N-terminal cleavage/methylation domain-containing protein [Acetobacteraceae bacterium]QKE92057.1 prepilin-type N-terminal cleavage/methylation domain-containing protein [Lichenicola cladoniae]